MNDSSGVPAAQGESLDLRDLLDDMENQDLGEYLTISVKNDGQNTTLSVTTIADQPETYSTVFYGVAATNLQMLLDDGNVAQDSA